MADEVSIVARVELAAAIVGQAEPERIASPVRATPVEHTTRDQPRREAASVRDRATNSGACQTGSGIHPSEAERADHMCNIDLRSFGITGKESGAALFTGAANGRPTPRRFRLRLLARFALAASPQVGFF